MYVCFKTSHYLIEFMKQKNAKLNHLMKFISNHLSQELKQISWSSMKDLSSNCKCFYQQESWCGQNGELSSLLWFYCKITLIQTFRLDSMVNPSRLMVNNIGVPIGQVFDFLDILLFSSLREALKKTVNFKDIVIKGG